jgi:hypothetical protein
MVDRNAMDQHFLWTPGRFVLTNARRLSSERIDGHCHLVERFQNSNHMGPSEYPHFAVTSPKTATDKNHGIDRLVDQETILAHCQHREGH